MKTLPYLLSILFIGCAKPLTPSIYHGCYGTQICAYDAFRAFLGVVQAKNANGTEILTPTNYHIFLDSRGREVDASYQRYRIITDSWPITEYSQMGVLVSDPDKMQSTTLSLIVEDGKKPIRMCYNGEFLPTDNGTIFYELTRVSEDKEHPGVYIYNNQGKVADQGQFFVSKICSPEEASVDHYFRRPISVRMADGRPYKGDIFDGTPL